MDYFKEIKKIQDEFKKTPRESIIKLLEEVNSATRGLPKIDFFEGRPDRLISLSNFHSEYAELIGKMIESNTIHGGRLKDDIENFIIIQRIHEAEQSIKDCKEGEINEIKGIRLTRAYSSLIEILWGKLKKIVFLSGLNPKDGHLNLLTLKNKFIELEKKYSISLPYIKSIIDGDLRNFIGHEKTYFLSPKTIVFSDIQGGKYREVKRVTIKELDELIVEIMIAITSIVSVETSALASYLQLLLNLSDEDLEEFMKTGQLTPEMEKRFIQSRISFNRFLITGNCLLYL